MSRQVSHARSISERAIAGIKKPTTKGLQLFQRGRDKVFRTDEQKRATARGAQLFRIYRDQYPNGLPHNELGVKYAKYMVRTMAFDPIDCRAQWLDRYTPWMDADMRAKLLSMGPHWYSKWSLGQHLELYDEDRERLQAWTIEACDVTKEQREEINREKERKRSEQRRRKNGAATRDQYEANSISRLAPWKLLGIGRSKFYQIPKEEREAAIRQAAEQVRRQVRPGLLLLTKADALVHAIGRPSPADNAQPSVGSVSDGQMMTSPCALPSNVVPFPQPRQQRASIATDERNAA
jgi:hypothetical protein